MRFSHLTAAALIVILHLILPVSLALWTWEKSYASLTGLSIQVLVLMS